MQPTFYAKDFHYEIIQEQIDSLYRRLKQSMHNILTMIEKDEEIKGLYNPKKIITIECDDNTSFEKNQIFLRGLNSFIYYNSILLSSYSIFEHSLKLVCIFIEKHIDPAMEFTHPSTDILNGCLAYIRKTQLINLNERELARNNKQIQEVKALRNLIAHHNGNLIRDKNVPLEKQKHYCVFKSDKHLIIKENGQVYINNSDYIKSFADTSESFLKTIIEEIKNDHYPPR